MPSAERTMPPISVRYTSMEKYSFACSFLPSPNVFATIALPPVPIMKPKAEIAMRNGMIRLTAANAVFPT